MLKLLEQTQKRDWRRSENMAKKLTAKAPLFGNNRSHSCRATKHKQNVNLQKVTLDDGTAVRMSARELRTLKKYS